MRVKTIIAAIAISMNFSASHAADLAAPTDAVALTVFGMVATKNAPEGATLDLKMLAAMPATTFKTSTVWTEGVNEYTGVSLAELVDSLGITGTMLHLYAINDYMVEVPLTDAVENGPIVAYLSNGTEMSVRDKGPLWLIYPFDDNNAYQTDVIFARSIWQLNRIESVQ
jgi:hypothetical protein